MADHVPIIRQAPGKAPQEGRIAPAAAGAGAADAPLISCLMVTRGAVFPAMFAIQCYRRQSYRPRELVIVCDAADAAIERHVTALGDATIHFVRTVPALLGELRNVAVAHAQGELLCQWDDDDLYHPDRLALQAQALVEQDVAAAFLHRWLVWWPARRVLAVSGRRVWEGSMLARRACVAIYPARAIDEDRAMATRMCNVHPIALVDAPMAYCYVVHGGNSYGEAHFEQMLRWSSSTSDPGGYDGDLATMAETFPMREYADVLAARS